MDLLKKLITGKISLSLTMFVFWFPSLLLSQAALVGLVILGSGIEALVVFAVVKLLFCLIIFSGIAFMLSKNFTLWRLISLVAVYAEFP